MNRSRRAVARACACLCMAAALPLSTSASVQVGCESTQMTYYGGPVTADVRVVPVLWSSHVNTEIQTKIASFYADVTASHWFDVLVEYPTHGQWIGPGTATGAVTLTPLLCGSSANCTVTDTDLQNELARDIQSGLLPAPQTDSANDPNSAYMLHIPPNVTVTNGVSTSCSDFCAYHSTFLFGAGNVPVPYAVVMDTYSSACSLGCGANSTAFDNTTDIASWQLAGIVTDPEIGLDTQGFYAFPGAWADGSSQNCGEVGDVCNDGSTGDTIVVNGRTSVVKEVWSQKQGKCTSTSTLGPAAYFSFSAPSQSTTGASVAFNLFALMPNGTGYPYAGTVHFTSTDPNAVLPADYTFTPGEGGLAGLNATLNNAGTQTITATDTLNARVVGTSAAINVDGTGLTTACPTTFTENQSIALSATVHSGTTPTGNVDFDNGATVLCGAVALSFGNAACQTPALTVQGGATSSVYAVVANYAGDAGNSPSSSPALNLTVLKASDVVYRGGFEQAVAGCPNH